MMKDLGSVSTVAEATSGNLQAAFDADMASANVPEIFDYFVKLKK